MNERSRVLVLQELLHAVPAAAMLVDPRYYGAGYTLLRQGAPARHVFNLASGWVQTSHVSSRGKVAVDLAGPGALLGLAEALMGVPLTISAVTVQECELECVETAQFLALLESFPALSAELLKRLSGQLLKSSRRFYDLAGKTPAEERLLSILQEMAEACGSPTGAGVRIELPLTQQVLGDQIGCSRQWVSKLLGSLEARGLIKRLRSEVTLVSPSAAPPGR